MGKNYVKYFIDYKNDEKVKPLCMLPNMSGHTRSSKCMSFLMSGKFNRIWNKVSNSIKKGFYSESVHNEKYLRK